MIAESGTGAFARTINSNLPVSAVHPAYFIGLSTGRYYNKESLHNPTVFVCRSIVIVINIKL